MTGFQDRNQDPQVVAARMQSYTGKAVAALILYMFFWIPGFIANVLFYREAKRMERIAGQSLPGTGCLSILFWLSILSLAAIVLGAIALAAGASH